MASLSSVSGASASLESLRDGLRRLLWPCPGSRAGVVPSRAWARFILEIVTRVYASVPTLLALI
jgi:hypothetical protein